MNFLPLFFDLSKGEVILVGSTAHAIAKLNVLRAAGASVRWFSAQFDVSDDLLQAANHAGQIGVTIGEPDAAVLGHFLYDFDEFVAPFRA